MADKKKADYQEGLEKSHADSVARSRDSYMKYPEKSCARSRESYMNDQEKSRADSAARSHVRYKNDLEKSHDDSAAWSGEHRCRNWGLKGPVPAQYCVNILMVKHRNSILSPPNEDLLPTPMALTVT